MKTPPGHFALGSVEIATKAINDAVMPIVNEAITVKEVAKVIKPVTSKMTMNCSTKIVCDQCLV